MVESTCFQHTSSHPDKYNNSVDRIISKEEEREDPRRDSSIFLRIQWCFHISTRTTRFLRIQCILQCFTRNPATPSNSTYRINSSTRILQEILQLQGSSRADHYKASFSNCSRVSKHSTRQNPAIRPYSTSRLPVILPGRNSILSGSQHPRNPYSSSQAHSYRTLPGEIGFIPKGLSIVCPCNTKVSVFQFTYSCA